jgi:hypothetical protein
MSAGPVTADDLGPNAFVCPDGLVHSLDVQTSPVERNRHRRTRALWFGAAMAAGALTGWGLDAVAGARAGDGAAAHLWLALFAPASAYLVEDRVRFALALAGAKLGGLGAASAAGACLVAGGALPFAFAGPDVPVLASAACATAVYAVGCWRLAAHDPEGPPRLLYETSPAAPRGGMYRNAPGVRAGRSEPASALARFWRRGARSALAASTLGAFVVGSYVALAGVGPGPEFGWARAAAALLWVHWLVAQGARQSSLASRWHRLAGAAWAFWAAVPPALVYLFVRAPLFSFLLATGALFEAAALALTERPVRTEVERRPARRRA